MTDLKLVLYTNNAHKVAEIKTMFDLPDMENVIKVTVDSSSVKGKTEPIVTYGKKTSTSVA